MIQINIVDTLLGYLGEYVNVDIRDENTDRLLCNYDGRNSINEEYLGSEIKNFVVDNGLVTIWVECKKQIPSADRPTGEWKKIDTWRYCSECGWTIYTEDDRAYNYCPNCGEKMELV